MKTSIAVSIQPVSYSPEEFAAACDSLAWRCPSFCQTEIACRQTSAASRAIDLGLPVALEVPLTLDIDATRDTAVDLKLPLAA